MVPMVARNLHGYESIMAMREIQGRPAGRSRPRLSVVTTLYRSAPYINEFCDRVSDAAEALFEGDYEIVLVNDGSPDESLEVARAALSRHCRLRIVDLSRNFGQHKAIMTGLAHARGDLVFLLDSDLEEDPAWLKAFAVRLSQTGADVVYGVQSRRRGGLVERWAGAVFYRLFNFLAGEKLPSGIVTARLMTRRYVEALLQHEERESFIAGLWAITGFEQVQSEVKKLSTSPTSYDFSRKFSIVMNSVAAFSSVPLRLIFYTGLVLSLVAGAGLLVIVAQYFFYQQPMIGWTSVIASIWFLGGLNILFVGVVGLYISKIYTEVKKRPYTIVRDVFQREVDRHD